MKLNNRGNVSLISLLIVAVIAIVGIVLYFNNVGDMGEKSMSPAEKSILNNNGGHGKTIIGKSFDAGRSVDCRTRISQIKQAIEMYKTNSEDGTTNAPTLNDLNMGVGAEYFTCPLSKQPYTYDTNAGTISCPTHPNY